MRKNNGLEGFLMLLIVVTLLIKAALIAGICLVVFLLYKTLTKD